MRIILFVGSIFGLLVLVCACAPVVKQSSRPIAFVANLDEQAVLDSIDSLQRRRRTSVFTGKSAGEELRTLRVRMFFLNPDWTVDTREAVLSEDVFVGMTAKQVLTSWGKPDAVHYGVGADGDKDQWVYLWSGQQLFVQSGKVVAFDNRVMESSGS